MSQELSAELSIDYSDETLRPALPRHRVFHLTGERFVIGRAPGCDLQIDHQAVSRQHAVIMAEERRYYVKDLGSTNGSFLNGKQLEPGRRYPLHANDLFQITSVLVLRFEDPTGTVRMKTSRPYLSGRFWLDAGKQQVYIRHRRLDPALSRQQYQLLALLVRRDGGVITRDEIADAIWPEARGDVSDNTIDNLVKRLRQRLANADGSSHQYIETVRGRGFRFRRPK
jgi:DNA-binding winged helix-turn-helix (wHTH) protein